MHKGTVILRLMKRALLQLIMVQENLQNPPIQKLLKTLSLHWLVNVHSKTNGARFGHGYMRQKTRCIAIYA